MSMFCASLGSFAQPSRAPLQTFSSGGATGTITSGKPTHFSSVGQPMVLPRPIKTNTGGGVMNANELMFSNVDTSPPVFGANTTAITVAPGEALAITANFMDDQSGVSSALVQYRSVNATSPAFIDGTPGLIKATGDSWTGAIPSSAIGELGVEYKFKITNGASLSATSPLYKVTINHASGIPITINTAFSKSQKNYRIIAIPLVLTANTVNAVFSKNFGDYDEDVWRMYHYDNTIEPNLKQLSGTSPLEPGKGYWFISTKSPTGSLSTGAGATVQASFDDPYKITLNQGWNQIGNPYNFNILWTDIRNANPTIADNLSALARTFDGSVKETDVIKKFEGVYVSFTGSGQTQLKIPVTRNPTAGRMGSNETKNPLHHEHWEVKFQLTNGIQQYDLGGVGMHPKAKEGVDVYDDFNIPRFFEYLEVKHPKQFYDMSYTKDIVATQKDYVWNFTTETNQPGDAITLHWDNSYFGNGPELWLMDVETGMVWDMRKENNLSIKYAPIHKWRVAFGNELFVKEATLPDINSLISTYPNPFSSEISIEVAMAESSPAKLEILDVNGKNVLTLINQPMDRGRYVTKWIGGNNGSEEVASGIYIVRFQTGTVVQYKRIIKK